MRLKVSQMRLAMTTVNSTRSSLTLSSSKESSSGNSTTDLRIWDVTTSKLKTWERLPGTEGIDLQQNLRRQRSHR